MKEQLQKLYDLLRRLQYEAVSEASKWEGTDTTYGDTGRNASDVEFGKAMAYIDAAEEIKKLSTKLNLKLEE